uniref:40S ribosomal protein S12 n=1 Tax=Xiphophorus maculatus TaxID=8083 RepID=A0A3B5RE53_XIPMA
MAEEGTAAGGVMDVNTALPEVLKTALIHDGLARGIREAAKALDKRQAHLCVLAANCDEPMYVKLVEALCAEHQINLIKVSDWFIKADVGFLDFFSIQGFVKGTSVSVMTTWLPLLNPVRRLPLLPNFDLRCSPVHMAFISSLLRLLCTVWKPTS